MQTAAVALFRGTGLYLTLIPVPHSRPDASMREYGCFISRAYCSTLGVWWKLCSASKPLRNEQIYCWWVLMITDFSSLLIFICMRPHKGLLLC